MAVLSDRYKYKTYYQNQRPVFRTDERVSSSGNIIIHVDGLFMQLLNIWCKNLTELNEEIDKFTSQLILTLFSQELIKQLKKIRKVSEDLNIINFFNLTEIYRLLQLIIELYNLFKSMWNITKAEYMLGHKKSLNKFQMQTSNIYIYI